MQVDLPTLCLEPMPGLQRRARAERHALERPLIDRSLRRHLGLSAEAPATWRVEWLGSGKPVVRADGVDALELSLSHDDAYCLCTVGPPPQGCDLAPVHHASAEGWADLLGAERSRTVEALRAHGEHLDVAGTRVWAAAEAVLKATGAPSVGLDLLQYADGAALFAVAGAPRPLEVLTLELALLDGRTRLVSTIVARPTRASTPP